MCEPLDCLGRSRVGHRPEDRVLVVARGRSNCESLALLLIKGGAERGWGHPILRMERPPRVL
jgi:hypothetical protein